MSALNISLPKALKKYVEKRVATGDWCTPSEYIRELIRQDKERRLGAKAEENRAETPQRRRRQSLRMRERVKSGLEVMEEVLAERRAAERSE
jgi:putative addiction module CopG family antidote